ncbi:MAG: hypothetical protein ABII74_05130 [Elusimicrobiota bacterium]
MNKRKLLSIIISAFYLFVSYLMGGPELFLKCIIFLIFPLAGIWYSNELGQFTGIVRMHWVSNPTPGIFVEFAGWLLLLFPIILAIISSISNK